MIAVGVDTHKYQHIAVALDALGQLLGEIAVAATVAGYRELVCWLAGLSSVNGVARTRVSTADRLACVAGHDDATGRGGNAASSCAPVVFTSPVAGDAASVAAAVITCWLLLTVTRCSRRTGSAGSRPGIPAPAVQPGRGRAGGRGRRALR